MSRTDLTHWTQLWNDLRANGEPAAVHQRLIAAYSEAHRHYHNLQHLNECLRELDAARAHAKNPAVVEAALWFHDAIYDSHSNSNEEDSAALADACFSTAGLSSAAIDEMRQLILCTKTHQPGAHEDAPLLIDIDLAILGQPSSRFFEYERGIKAEYSWVLAATYTQKRTEILAGFLSRPTIYKNPRFRDLYENSARTNLATAIDALHHSTSGD